MAAPPVSWRGLRALVTGASSGIGAAIAGELAAAGVHLVLTARRLDRLDAVASDLRQRFGIEVHAVEADLSLDNAPDDILAFTMEHGLAIDILVNNAGLADHGEFRASRLGTQLAMVKVHCSAVVHLTHLFVGGMVERRRGFVLVVATTTLAPAPYMTTYAATKGFDLLFAEGLAEEVARLGIVVSALCPGPTESELVVNVEGASAGDGPAFQSAQEVARKALAGLARGQRCIRPSWAAWIVANVPRWLPRNTVSGMTERFYRPRNL